jgi:hypothetical protein
MAIINKINNNESGKDVQKKEPLYTIGGNANSWSWNKIKNKLMQPIWKSGWSFLKKKKTNYN